VLSRQVLALCVVTLFLVNEFQEIGRVCQISRNCGHIKLWGFLPNQYQTYKEETLSDAIMRGLSEPRCVHLEFTYEVGPDPWLLAL